MGDCLLRVQHHSPPTKTGRGFVTVPERKKRKSPPGGGGEAPPILDIILPTCEALDNTSLTRVRTMATLTREAIRIVALFFSCGRCGRQIPLLLGVPLPLLLLKLRLPCARDTREECGRLHLFLGTRLHRCPHPCEKPRLSANAATRARSSALRNGGSSSTSWRSSDERHVLTRCSAASLTVGGRGCGGG